MLALLTSVNLSLLHFFWSVSLSFFSVALFLCMAIMLRRIWRNKSAAKRKQEKTNFQNHIGQLLNTSYRPQQVPDSPACNVQDMADVFLHFFRTLKGEKLEYLQEIISETGIEARIINKTYKGVRGSRMSALRALSYLSSQKSLQVIFEGLSSKDKYVRLTAMRCLVRRKASFFVNSIVESYVKAFPRDYKLLASILANFGNEISESLEGLVNSSDQDLVKTACLEALILIRPAKTSLDFDSLMESESEIVRAAALSLAATTTHSQALNHLRLGLKDESITVKIRAAKMAHYLKSKDLMPELLELSTSPALWVRYWAFKAMWGTGLSGQKFVMSLSKSDVTAANFVREMNSGYA